jgi:teichuronic acid exporter
MRADAPGVGPGDARRHLIRGLAWVGALRWTGQVISWGSTLLVMRLLVPTDYGLMAMAFVFTGVAQMLADFGIGSTVVAMQTLRVEEEEQLHATSLMLGGIALLATAISAYPMSRFFHEPALVAIIAALGFPLLIQAAGAVPLARLTKALDYRAMAVADLLRTLGGVLVSLALAIAGAGVWALVGGQIASALAATGFVLLREHVSIRRPDFVHLRLALAYSRDTMLSRVGWMAYTYSANLIGGRLLGARVLGEFTFAWSVSSMPGDKAVGVIGGVAAPILAREQRNEVRLRQLLQLMIEGIAFVTWPMLAGLAVVAPLAVEVVFGSKWSGAVDPLVVLCLYWMTSTVSSPFAHVFLATGAARLNRQLSMIGLLLLPGAFWFGARMAGPTGLAWAWLATVPVIVVPSLFMLKRRIGFGPREFFDAVKVAGLATGLMALAVKGVLWSAGGSNTSRLASAIAVGGLTFTATAWIVRRRELLQFFHAMRHSAQPIPTQDVDEIDAP